MTDTLNEVPGQPMSSILTAGSDIALVLDRSGVILDVVLGQADEPLEESRAWLGRELIDIVTDASRRQITAMLAEVASRGVSRKRHVSHPSGTGGG